ncbi:MAG: hypothetical protein JXB03_10330 [Spirochaetales bacterium]|nr:hypothetical protein [Spirochaetales bacterium]
MVKAKNLLFLLLGLGISVSAWAYPVRYAEQWYKLYHTHFYQNPENLKENLYYLEHALSSDFANPLHAIGGPLDDRIAWEKYRNLFYMHVNLEIIKLYRTMARKYDREHAYFFNAPWKEENLESLEIAEYLYKAAKTYWPAAVEYADKAGVRPFLFLENLEAWEDEQYRIQTGTLDYDAIIDMDLAHLEEIRNDFLAMGPDTY